MALGLFTFSDKATSAQKAVIRPVLESIVESPIHSRLKTITLVPKRSDQMPDWDSSTAGVQPAWELWKGWNSKTSRRELWYWDKLHTKDECEATILHGIAGHAYDDIYLATRPELRALLMGYMDPEPEAWLQGRTWSKFPYECNAVYGSAALFDLDQPVYKNLLDRHVAKEDWPVYADILLS